jgi:hypothetical protein
MVPAAVETHSMTTALATQVAFKEKAPEGHFGADLPDASAAILQARIKDLQLHLKGTRLERFISQLYEELEAKGHLAAARSATSRISGAARRACRSSAFPSTWPTRS